MADNRRILVTGATGFIGGRLVEALARRGRRLRIVTSDFRRCARVARFAVEMVKADLLAPEAFARTVDGCDTVFHLAFRFGGSADQMRRANLGGTRALAEAALANGVRRFVHFSSVAAYGAPADGDLTENSEPRPARDGYSETKQRIDDMLRDLNVRRQLPVTILQPTIVYGPYGYTWTIRLLEQVVAGNVVLPARGSGLCNAVYVDDVVNAALLAGESDAAVGESFLISGAAPVTWQAFYQAYEQMAGADSVRPMDDVQMEAEKRRLRARTSLTRRLQIALARRPDVRERVLGQAPQRWLLRGGDLLLPDRAKRSIQGWYDNLWQAPPAPAASVYLPDPGTLALYAAKTNVRIDKARNRLGFIPAFDLETGMSKTAMWARWANLVSS